MGDRLETRREHGERLRQLWSTHTHNSEPVRKAFFEEIERAITWGPIASVSIIGEMLCVLRRSETVYVMFPSPTLRAGFLDELNSFWPTIPT
jgi:hypothetical protein